MIVGFTGTSGTPTDAQRRAVRRLLLKWQPMHGYHGDCVGADRMFHELCGTTIITVIHPPTNPRRRAFCQPNLLGGLTPPRPYLDRNHDIVDACDRLIACPKEQEGEALRSGTWATVRYARKKGKPIWIVRPDGAIERERS